MTELKTQKSNVQFKIISTWKKQGNLFWKFLKYRDKYVEQEN
jgi:hypothetical protein